MAVINVTPYSFRTEHRIAIRIVLSNSCCCCMKGGHLNGGRKTDATGRHGLVLAGRHGRAFEEDQVPIKRQTVLVRGSDYAIGEARAALLIRRRLPGSPEED